MICANEIKIYTLGDFFFFSQEHLIPWRIRCEETFQRVGKKKKFPRLGLVVILLFSLSTLLEFHRVAAAGSLITYLCETPSQPVDGRLRDSLGVSGKTWLNVLLVVRLAARVVKIFKATYREPLTLFDVIASQHDVYRTEKNLKNLKVSFDKYGGQDITKLAANKC